MRKRKRRTGVLLIFIGIAFSIFGFLWGNMPGDDKYYSVTTDGPVEKKYIKWVDFNIPYEILDQAYRYDVKSYGEEVKLNFVELLSYSAAKSGGKFTNKRSSDMDELVERLKNGETMDDITSNMKYYSYYHEAYEAVLGEFIGEYLEKGEKKYGLKVFSPIAKGFGFGHYDDFGNERSYGYKRKHLGNDLLGSIGTPVIAVEGGTIEALGWNQYGGWRVGIRSLDKKRYYYYAHLRKDHPYPKWLEPGLPEVDTVPAAIGTTVNAGDVIGYMGMTGYSNKINVNNIKVPHLHFGLQLIFDESQKDGTNQIWVDVYHIIKLLQKSKSEVVKDEETKDYSRVNEIDCLLNLGKNDGIEVPIIMYHSILNDPKQQGKYVLSPDILKNDMSYLKQNGYETVTVTDLINYVYEDTPLPEKPVVLTFDDGFYNNLLYVLPLLEEFDMKAVVSVVGKYSKQFSEINDVNPAYAYLSYDNIKMLAESGRVEIGNHSYDMHEFGSRKGSAKKRSEGKDQYKSILEENLVHLQKELKEKSSIEPITFAYPYGIISDDSLEVVKQLGFKASLSCYEKPNYITKDPACLYQLNRYNRPSGISTERFMNKIL